MLLQTLAARLGVVTGRDLAQSCRDAYNPVVRWILFVLCEIAIAACDLAEVLGTAIGINLLSAMFMPKTIPLELAILITAGDVFLLLAIQRFGIRKMEAVIVSLVAIIGMCFIVQIFLSKPVPGEVVRGLIPSSMTREMVFVAIGIIGATVMPHNLYLHSALVQSRKVQRTPAGIRQANKFYFFDSAIALNCAFFVNAAILIVAAATFHSRGIEVGEIQQAHAMLANILGSKWAPAAFAIALICAGQSSTITATLAGQITMEGFIHFRMRPWVRRLTTRLLAIVPAIIVIHLTGEGGTTRLLVVSQVILSLQLPFAIVPLVKFTSSKVRMGEFASPLIMTLLAWLSATIILSLNVYFLIGQFGDWSQAAGGRAWAVWATVLPLSTALLVMLIYMTFRRETIVSRPVSPKELIDRVARESAADPRPIRSIGVALGADASDGPMLREAIALARLHSAELVLFHIVEGVGGQYLGTQAGDVEQRSDEEYLTELADRVRRELNANAPPVRFVLGYGGVRRQLIKLINESGVDMAVLGGHGHRGLWDLLHGSTIEGVRHGVKVPILAVGSYA